jgi:hypothetical protein
MFDRRVRIPATAGLLGMASLLSSLQGAAQDSPCDRGLEQLSRGPYGYRLHGDRCEGIYSREVAGTTLWVASLTEAFESYDLTSRADLIVEWTAPGDSTIRLRAEGTRRGLYYRMDAVRPAGSRSYRWPSDLLAAQHISQNDIGVLGWTRYRLGSVDRDIYIPLRISQHHPAPTAGVYDLVLFPTVTLREVYVSLAPVGPDGSPRNFIQQGKRLGYRFYPAERPVSIKLPSLGEAGVYYLEIGADLAAGGSVALTYWIYHAQAPRTN